MSVIDQLQAKAQKDAERKRKQYLEQRNKFYETVAERQHGTGQGVYGKHSEEYTKTKEGKIIKSIGKDKNYVAGDVRKQAVKEAEARVEAERQYYRDQPKSSLSAGKRNRDGSRVTSVSGTRPAPPTEADLQQRLSSAREKVAERHQQQKSNRVPSQNPEFVAYRELKEQASRAGYDLDGHTTVKQHVEERDGQSYEVTRASADYQQSKASIENANRQAKAEQQTAIQNELTKITSMPNFAGYSLTYGKDGSATINYTLGSQQASPLSINQPQSEKEFLAEKAKQGLIFTGNKTTNPLTGETSYEFFDKNERDRLLREQNTRTKVLKANAIYIGYKAEEEYDEQGNVIGYSFVPREGKKQSRVFNSAGTEVTSEFLRGEIRPDEYKQLRFETTPDRDLNLQENVFRGTVGLLGETAGGLLELGTAVGAKIYEGVTGDKSGAQATRDEISNVTKEIRKSTSLDALSAFYLELGKATGNTNFDVLSIHAKEQAKTDTPAVVSPILGAGSALAEQFGSPEGKQLREEFVKQTTERPVETIFSGGIDALTLGFGSGVAGASKAGSAGRVGRVVSESTSAGKVLKNNPLKEVKITNEPIKTFDNKTIDLGAGVAKVDQTPTFKNVTISLGKGEGKVVKKDDYGLGSYGKDNYGSGGSSKTDKPKSDYGSQKKVKKTETGATYEYTSKQGSLLLEEPLQTQQVADDVAKQVDETTTTKQTSEPIEIPEGYLPPEEQLVITDQTLGLGDSNLALLAKQRARQEKLDRQKQRKERQEKLRKENIGREFVELGKGKQVGKRRAKFLQEVRQKGKGKLTGQQRTEQLQERQVILTTLQGLGQKKKQFTRSNSLSGPAQTTKTVQSPIQSFAQRVTQAQQFKRKTGQVQKTDVVELEKTLTKTEQRFGQSFRFDEGKMKVPTQGRLEIPKNVPVGRGILLPRGGGGGSILNFGSRRDGATRNKDYSVANILYGDLSIVGTSRNDDQRGGAIRQLNLSIKDRGKIDFIDKPTKSNRKKGKRNKNILDIF